MPTPAENVKIRLSFIGNPVVAVSAPKQMEGELIPSDLKIQYFVQVIVNRPQSCVEVVVSMSYNYGQKDLFSGSITTTFEVIDLATFITAKEGEEEFRLESDFLPMLINIAFSSARGYFARELTDTVLAPYPFPMISMENIQKRTTYRLI